MLRAAGIPVYQRLNVHGYWTLAGGKMSKSVGNVVEALKLAETYGRDAFRYFVLRDMTFGLDATFSEEALVDRLNADLANDLGNLVSRAIAMLTNFSGAAVPAPGPAGPAEEEVQEGLVRAREVVQATMEEFAFHRALMAIWEWIGALNRYIDAQAPWVLAKDPTKGERLRTVLYTLAEALRALAVLLDPFLPDSAGALSRQLSLSGPHRLADLGPWGRMVPGTRVTKRPALFPRVDVSRGPVAARRDEAPAGLPQSGVASRVSIEEFARLDLRVAEVIDAEPIPKSKKLLKLTVTLANETRTVVAGIAEQYAPETLRGRKVVLVTNLEPATLMGVQSNGMILAGSDGGVLALLALDRDLPPGAKVS
jgi:methionyl-tRNA synthetase